MPAPFRPEGALSHWNNEVLLAGHVWNQLLSFSQWPLKELGTLGLCLQMYPFILVVVVVLFTHGLFLFSLFVCLHSCKNTGSSRALFPLHQGCLAMTAMALQHTARQTLLYCFNDVYFNTVAWKFIFVLVLVWMCHFWHQTYVIFISIL